MGKSATTPAQHGQASSDELQAHEITDVPLRPLIVFVVVLVSTLAVVCYGMAVGLKAFKSRESASAGLPSPTPPPIREGVQAPPLQGAPHDDLIKMRVEERAILDGAAYTNKDAGRVRIPIDDAMKLLLEQGLPARPSSAPITLDPAAKPLGRTRTDDESKLEKKEH